MPAPRFLAGPGNFPSALGALPAPIGKWCVQRRLVNTGGRLTKHARYYWLLLAEIHLTRRLFGGMLRRIAPLRSLPAD